MKRTDLVGAPESVYAGLRETGFNTLIHTQAGDGWSYCIKGSAPQQIDLDELDGLVTKKDRPIHDDDAPPLQEGWLLFLSYDLCRDFENIPSKNPEMISMPKIMLCEIHELLAYDHANGIWWTNSKDLNDIDQHVDAEEFHIGEWEEAPTRDEYISMVEKAKEYIAAGDIYQVNLARWFSAEFSGDSFALYRNLVRRNPSPYGFYAEIKIDDRKLDFVSVSPELLIQRTRDKLITRPIAGTYPKNLSIEDLPRDPKERAEHIMLIDLERNDLGRIADFGSVEVTEFLGVEEYSHLYHIVSQVEARDSEGIKISELLGSVFPGGTITGTPKIRAMEIINELERFERGPYTGTVGFLTPSGDITLNIVIRTAYVANDRIHVAAGSGIVADSIPEKEAAESAIKAAAILELKDLIPA